jgi:hypothetical protein
VTTATEIISPTSIEHIEARIAPLRARLTAHPLYASIRTPLHLRLFMQSHVFAVWDFMSLLKAMQQAGADAAPIETLIAAIHHGRFSPSAIDASDATRTFVETTFRIIYSGNLAATAAAFTFGREDVIPDIFRNLVRDLNTQHSGEFSKFIWYLERHIEVDGEEHGPLSLRMVADLCGHDEALWEEAAQAAESALEARLALWDGILATIHLGN